MYRWAPQAHFDVDDPIVRYKKKLPYSDNAYNKIKPKKNDSTKAKVSNILFGKELNLPTY